MKVFFVIKLRIFIYEQPIFQFTQKFQIPDMEDEQSNKRL